MVMDHAALKPLSPKQFWPQLVFLVAGLGVCVFFAAWPAEGFPFPQLGRETGLFVRFWGAVFLFFQILLANWSCCNRSWLSSLEEFFPILWFLVLADISQRLALFFALGNGLFDSPLPTLVFLIGFGTLFFWSRVLRLAGRSGAWLMLLWGVAAFHVDSLGHLADLHMGNASWIVKIPLVLIPDLGVLSVRDVAVFGSGFSLSTAALYLGYLAGMIFFSVEFERWVRDWVHT